MLTLPNDRLSTAAILPACLPEDGVGRIIGALAHALPAIPETPRPRPTPPKPSTRGLYTYKTPSYLHNISHSNNMKMFSTPFYKHYIIVIMIHVIYFTLVKAYI